MSITDFAKPTPIVVETLDSLDPGCALDIGAGYGRNSLYLAEKGWDVDAVDIDKIAIDKINTAATKGKINIKAFNVAFSEFHATKSYDAIICLMTLHFMEKPEIDTTIQRIKQHTLPNGIVIISGFTDGNPIDTRPYLFKENELKDHFSTWTTLAYEYNVESSVLRQDTQEVATYKVTRIVAKNTVAQPSRGAQAQ